MLKHIDGPHIHRTLIVCGTKYLECEQLVNGDSTKSIVTSPVHLCREVDYSGVVDACLEDLPEGKYL